MKPCQLTTCISCIVFFTAINSASASGYFVENSKTVNYQPGLHVKEDSLAKVARYQQLAHDLYSRGAYKKAIVQWKKVLNLQPCNAFAMFMLGKSYMCAGKHKKGAALCDKAVDL